jgi:hypothetical protein
VIAEVDMVDVAGRLRLTVPDGGRAIFSLKPAARIYLD